MHVLLKCFWIFLQHFLQVTLCQEFKILHHPLQLTTVAGGNVSIQCELSPPVHPPQLIIYWHRRNPDGQPMYPMSHNGGDKRVQIQNVSGNSVWLCFVDITLQDADVYFCSFHVPQLNRNLSSQEIQLKVFGAPTQPTLKVQNDSDVIILTCQSGGFFPENISVSWIIDDKEQQDPRPIVQRNGQTYNLNSFRHITKDGGRGMIKVCCLIGHISLVKPLESEIIILETKGSRKSYLQEKYFNFFVLLFIVLLVVVLLLIRWCRIRVANGREDELKNNSFQTADNQAPSSSLEKDVCYAELLYPNKATEDASQLFTEAGRTTPIVRRAKCHARVGEQSSEIYDTIWSHV
ncbi:tyrosine-protein phosphatase non-receptor type substrate 1-like [Erpetoichthys calabaricus]|uniref:tyrosine-protein phosphatase non-receptor type substrate 1-like n=1 Tax=Erpetoichthys calabaricus TaxID=27687 RepID=UPI002234D0E6|nr:tyrosine-protein phosphatase non-receptor type substrate 1-like [Erpetoichthys calabaricus]